jgi:hypothetical protein
MGGGNRNRNTRQEAQKYRKAANDALQQLDWCIGYLHGIGKLDISRALSQNRSFIREHLMQREAQPLPTADEEAA